MQKNNYSQLVRAEAARLGFFSCGIAKAELLGNDALRLETWLKNGNQGNMSYMENHFDKRINPCLLVDGAKSVITLLFNYFPKKHQLNSDYKISKYAFGDDYHIVIKEKLNEFLNTLQNHIGEINGRGFVDSAPVLERAWAVKSGAGWVGKNGNLITKKQGSFFFIATLITDLELEPDIDFKTDHCGTCTKCIDACPTDAILPNKEINGSHCISYYTIELKDAIIDTNKTWANWMFGCDVCQDVCPWNRFSKPHNEPRFEMKPEIEQFTTNDWNEITDDIFKKVFNNSPLKRSKLTGLKRNINFLKMK
jgi:epoxyqueuosine reductase